MPMGIEERRYRPYSRRTRPRSRNPRTKKTNVSSRPQTVRKMATRSACVKRRVHSRGRCKTTYTDAARSQGSSVVFVSEVSCCLTEEERQKYLNLRLNPFHFSGQAPLTPKRTQSHLSVVTISSDDDDLAFEKTNKWLEENVMTRIIQNELNDDILSFSELLGMVDNIPIPQNVDITPDPKESEQ